jgi:acyl-CoA synthetase (AMP-forming)/AMP-acid ligase II
MVAAYGLAEATVGVSMWQPSTANGVDQRGTVSVGRPFPKVAVQILDEADHILPAGEAGHIVVTTPAATRGYFGNAAATEALFAGPDTVRTGDIGYLDDEGHLYILSRAKDTIIQAGRSIYPQEVEEAVNGVAGVRYAAAVGVDRGGIEGEQIIVLAEIRTEDMPDDDAKKLCAVAVTAAVRDRIGLSPARVHLVAPKTIPMTPNGKLRRGDLKTQYEAGRLQKAFLYPLSSAPVPCK